MNPTRRNFISMLPSLPLIGWLFGRAEGKPTIDPNRPYIEILGENSQQYHGAWETGYRLIRWVPVTERLPEDDQRLRTVLAVWKDGSISMLAVRPGEGHSLAFYKLMGITNFSEMPAPPETS